MIIGTEFEEYRWEDCVDFQVTANYWHAILPPILFEREAPRALRAATLQEDTA